VAKMTSFPAPPATVSSPWRHSRELVRNRLRPMIAVVSSGSKLLRKNSALFYLWLLFPLFLVLTSDWIGLLIVFQAMTAAVRLRNAPAAQTIAACSSPSVSARRVKGGYRAL
jgi:hypothetical protein